jgi:hypothetical protein
MYEYLCDTQLERKKGKRKKRGKRKQNRKEGGKKSEAGEQTEWHYYCPVAQPGRRLDVTPRRASPRLVSFPL